jgi:hypothetical protein
VPCGHTILSGARATSHPPIDHGRRKRADFARLVRCASVALHHEIEPETARRKRAVFMSKIGKFASNFAGGLMSCVIEFPLPLSVGIYRETRCGDAFQRHQIHEQNRKICL